MKRIFFAAAVLASMITTASAEIVTSTSCGRSGYRQHSCVTTSKVVTDVPVEQRTYEEIQKFNADWEAFCKPTRTDPDQYGVIRMIYAHPGCEFGRTF